MIRSTFRLLTGLFFLVVYTGIALVDRMVSFAFDAFDTAFKPLNWLPSVSEFKRMADRPAVRAFSSLLAKRSSEPVAFAI